MRRETWLWTVILLAGLALGIEEWWAARAPTMPAQSDAMAREDLLLGSGLEPVVKITLARAASSREVVRGRAGWRYGDSADPSGGNALAESDSAFISERLAMFAVARIDRFLEIDDRQLSLYGLEEAPDQITIENADGSVLHLVLGTRTPDGFGQYVLIETGRRVVVIPAYHVDNLMRLHSGS